MKFRVRYKNKTAVVTILNDNTAPTLKELKQKVEEQLSLTDAVLSLNKSDPIVGEELELPHFGIVSGDLIHVISATETSSSSDVPTAKDSSDDSLHDNTADVSACPSESASLASDNGPSVSTSSAAPMSVDDECMSLSDIEQPVQDQEVNRYLREAVLVRDCDGTNTPASLTAAYQAAGVGSRDGGLMAVLHVLMMESGYTLQSGSEGSLLEVWRVAGGYSVQYSHPTCPGVTFWLRGLPIGPLIIIHGVWKFEDKEDKYQLKLKSSDYVKDVQQEASGSYQNLPKLSRVFKDGISQPLLQTACEHLGIPLLQGFAGLLAEVKITILYYLDVKSLSRLSQASKDMSTLCNQQCFWRRLFFKDYGRRQNNDLNQDWKKLYKDTYVHRKYMREQMQRATLVAPPFFTPHPPLPFAPIYPPGAIGGDYDRDPDFGGLPGFVGPYPGRGGMPRPRFDPIGPLPRHRFPPGRGGGMWDGGGRRPPGGGGWMGGGGGGGFNMF